MAVFGLSGCAGPGEDAEAQGRSEEAAAAARGDGGIRPATSTDTLEIEGMREPIELRLFEAGDDFPLPFTAYIPQDMRAEVHGDGTLKIVAEFGGVRNENAFIHFYTFPEGTPWQEALATAKGFKAAQGIPVSRGLEPLQDDLPPPEGLAWAEEAYRYVYETGGQAFGGTLGVARREGRAFMIVTHRPVEYAEGFGPRAHIVMESWRWADGSALASGEGSAEAGSAPPVP